MKTCGRLRAWSGKRFPGICAAAVLGLGAVALAAQSNETPQIDFPTVLYGAAYYNEYMPGDQDARLEKDVELMKAAGLNVVRMGESTWSLWEPEDGRGIDKFR